MDTETLHKKINEHYQLGDGSIQDIARTYRLEVDEVLHILKLDDILEVESVGDMVDASEVDPGTVINRGKKQRAKFTTN